MTVNHLQYDLFGEHTHEPHIDCPLESIVAGAIFDFAAFVDQTCRAQLDWIEAVKDFAEYRSLRIDGADPMWELSLRDERNQ